MERASFHRLARRELIDAALFYELESRDLGSALLEEVHRTLRSILDHPQAGQLVARTLRRRLIRRFP